MARWIAFDQETTSLLRSNLTQGTKIDTLRRGPVDYALARPGTVVAVLPAQGSDLGIAVFRRVRPAEATPRPIVAQQPPVEQRPAVTQPPPMAQRTTVTQLPRAAVTPPPAVQPPAVAQPRRASMAPPITNHAPTRAGGFLGLSDEPVFEEEEEAVEEKRGWWRRLWEE